VLPLIIALSQGQHLCHRFSWLQIEQLGMSYRAELSPHWLKNKNPAASAVRRLEEEHWS
jgi:hypothetical protein